MKYLIEFLEYVKKEWKVVSTAPWTFIIALLLASTIIFLVIDWHYQERIRTLQEQNKTSTVRIEAKDDLLTEYRERLHITSASGSEYSFLTHHELKNKTLEFVQKLRDWLSKRNLESTHISNEGWNAVRMASSDEEKNRLWHQYTNREILSSLKFKAEYDQKFKVDSIILRDELLARLPEKDRNQRTYSMYENPVNPIGMGMVADDLEHMAKLLQ
jgi:nitrate/TMAO reductase-like tetraheme cytochrome c subunit